ncbi:tetratricopeptide repeat protein [uncultured Helicobacter sp.]|uniref:tetratricopeptide repeat protein n=1 Tax=uncultured Helicobacter sp. TaxID=175537 RepID=UPI0027DB7827|nr:tetratricopeptide repeat protein [uncultured Helicobacter sp.]
MQSLIKAFNQKQYEQSLRLSTQILQQDALNVQAWFICAMSLYYLGDIKHCVAYLECAYSLDPLNEDVVINLAEIYRRNGQNHTAIQMYLKCLPSQNPNLYYNLGLCYAKSGELKKAREAYERALELDENDKDAMYNLANIYAEEKDYKIAIKLYEKCQTIEAASNLVCMYNLIGNDKKGLSVCKDLDSDFALFPNNIKKADFYFNYANIARYNLLFEQSKILYQKAYAISPNPIYAINYAHLLLSLGEFKEGFRFYEKRLALPKQDIRNAHFFKSKKYINTQNLDSAGILDLIQNAKVLVFFEQGLGDTIMYARFLSLLPCKTLYVYVQDELRALFKEVGFRVVDRDFADFEYCVSLLSLPYVLGVESMQDIWANTHYLKPFFHSTSLGSRIKSPISPITSPHLASPQKSFTKSPKNTTLQGTMTQNTITKNTMKVGLFFYSNPNFIYAKDKSISLDVLLPYLNGLDIELHLLQPESREFFINESRLKSKELSHLISHRLNHFLDTARLIRELDMVVSVDSACAHLAIAMGKPCVILAHKRYDWRWGKLGQTRFHGMFGGYVLAQKKFQIWDNVLKDLREILQNPQILQNFLESKYNQMFSNKK